MLQETARVGPVVQLVLLQSCMQAMQRTVKEACNPSTLPFVLYPGRLSWPRRGWLVYNCQGSVTLGQKVQRSAVGPAKAHLRPAAHASTERHVSSVHACASCAGRVLTCKGGHYPYILPILTVL